ncbi:pyruvate kinase [Rickettsiales bacterium LUAb2]
MNQQNIFISRRVKIVATVGPAIKPIEKLEEMFLAGVNVFRLNFSHGEHEEHAQTYNNIRKIQAKYNAPIAILADMQGPKLRVGKFKEDKATLVSGQSFRLDLNPDLGDNKRVNLPHPQIFEALSKNAELLVDDGKIRFKVDNYGKDYAEVTVVVGGVISNFKGVNFPSGVLKLSPLTEKDLRDLEFSLSLGVDYIGLSFVQLPEDLLQAREIIKDRAKIISKIEKPSAVLNIDKIIQYSDAIMVARGDLGVEIPTESVPTIQKRIIKLSRQYSKPVIVATQMLDSMVSSPMPTRAEASDVANAVYDGADAVMLSAETTVGQYPVESVKVMSNIIHNVEADEAYWIRLKNDYPTLNFPMDISEAVSLSAGNISNIVSAKVIVAFTTHGTTVDRVCRERVKAPCLAITTSKSLYYQMNLNWGVKPMLIDKVSVLSEVITIAKDWLIKEKYVTKGDKIVIVAGSPVGVAGLTNNIRVVEVE